METADVSALVAIATSLAAEAKSLERRARGVKQQAAILRDHIEQLQSGDTSGITKHHN